MSKDYRGILYQLNNQLVSILNQHTDFDTGEIDTAVYTELDAIGLAREEILEQMALYIKELQAQEVALKTEQDSLASRRASVNKQIDGLKSSLTQELAGQRLETPKVAVSFRKSTSVNVIDMDTLPAIYRREKVTYTADKQEIKQALQAGHQVTGAELVERQNLQIK